MLSCELYSAQLFDGVSGHTPRFGVSERFLGQLANLGWVWSCRWIHSNHAAHLRVRVERDHCLGGLHNLHR